MRLYTDWTTADPVSAADKDYIVYFQKEYTHGRVDVIPNGVMPFKADCSCFSDHAKALQPAAGRLYKAPYSVVFLLVPNGATFYHFMDSVLPKIVQLESFLADPSLRFLIDLSPQHPIVGELVARLGIPQNRIINYRDINHLGDAIQAKRLVLTCNTPPLHPYLFQRAQYLLKLPHIQFPSKYKPCKVIYLSRRRGHAGRGPARDERVRAGEAPSHVRRGESLRLRSLLPRRVPRPGESARAVVASGGGDRPSRRRVHEHDVCAEGNGGDRVFAEWCGVHGHDVQGAPVGVSGGDGDGSPLLRGDVVVHEAR